MIILTLIGLSFDSLNNVKFDNDIYDKVFNVAVLNSDSMQTGQSLHQHF